MDLQSLKPFNVTDSVGIFGLATERVPFLGSSVISSLSAFFPP